MSDKEKKWGDITASLRRTIASLLPSEADAGITGGEAPLAEEELNRIVDAAFSKEELTYELEADYSWVNEVETEAVEEQMLVLNRNRGVDDADIEKRLEEHRARALGRSSTVSKGPDWKTAERGYQRAREIADEVASLLGLTAPINPFAVASEELPMLKVVAEDFGNRFDGQLEFHRPEHTFLMLVNTKYDANARPGEHHPRTRFSAAHELGHYFLDHHRACLLRGARPHPSASDFTSEMTMEREADHFASALLMPREAFVGRAKRLSTGLGTMLDLAKHFQTSLTSTAIRYTTLNVGPVVIIKWNPEGFGWKWCSDDAYAAQLRKTIENAKDVPSDSPTGRVLAGESPTSEPFFQAGTTAAAWFPFITHGARRNDILIEQAISLGEHGVLTVLSPQAGTYTRLSPE